MFYPIVPAAMHLARGSSSSHMGAIDAHGRGAHRHQQALCIERDFTDYNQQRYAAVRATRACRTAPPALAPPRSRWDVLRSWASASWAWFRQGQRG